VQEERLSRRKNDAAFPLGAIEWCLDHAGLEPGDLDAVVFYERSMLKFDRILTCALRAFPRSWRSFPQAMKNSLGEKVWVRGIIASHLGVPREDPLHRAPRSRTPPRRSSPRRPARRHPDRRRRRRMGDAHGRRRRAAPDGRDDITLLREIRFPHSLGMLYSTFTAYLGFAVNEDEYKVMGLAAYGRPTMVEQVRRS
jgi:carbamoyltransferase